ncbi:MAG: XRE family transcriptional regulator [Anaerotignum sp.]|nr:XRE family transcriptional regulator [Anaerotignum sp.]
MDINYVIGENLKALRLERNLSLGQLGEICGLSKVMLSQIEKGDGNPTINTIWKIADGLHVPYTTLLEKHAVDAQVIRKANLEAQQDESGHYRIFCYYPSSPQRNFELFRLELDGNHSYTSIGHPEQTQEYIWVLEGQLIMEVKGEQYTLNPDDALCFSASVPHTYHNLTDKTIKADIINFYLKK